MQPLTTVTCRPHRSDAGCSSLAGSHVILIHLQGVEPTEKKQNTEDVVPIPLILSAVFGAAITFFLILPNLPFTNADQL